MQIAQVSDVRPAITGRDGYIVMQALAYGIEANDRLPERWQDPGNRSDLVALLEALAGAELAEQLRISARIHLSEGLARRGREVA